jgi:hypothetical protein
MASAQEVQADECEPEPLPRSVAGDFELLKGRGVAVCEVYLKNLNAIGRYNIDYRRVVPEKFPEISIPNFGPRHHGFEPEWPLLRKVRDYLWERDANPAGRVVATEWPIWQGTPEQLAKASQFFLFQFEDRIDKYGYWIASLDIDNDGELDRVFFDNDPTWGIGGTILLVLEDEDDEIDVETTERILKHPSWRNSGLPPVRPLWPGEPGAPGIDVQPTEDARLGANYDIFLFEGKTYVDHWWWVHPEYSVFESLERGRVRVFLTERDASEEVCTARVKPRVLGVCE